MSVNGLPQRKVIRLPHAAYRQSGNACSITIAVRERKPVFADPKVATAAVDVLQTLASKLGIPVYAYCVMPDHVHLIAAPVEGCDVFTFVGQFKNLTLRQAWQLGLKGSFWQSSFWDHVLRHQDDLRQVAYYVLNNPVRRGLAKEWQEYPFSGSLVYAPGELV